MVLPAGACRIHLNSITVISLATDRTINFTYQNRKRRESSLGYSNFYSIIGFTITRTSLFRSFSKPFSPPDMERPSTPPRRTTRASEKAVNAAPLSPEVRRKIVRAILHYLVSFPLSTCPNTCAKYRKNPVFAPKNSALRKKQPPALPAPNPTFPRPLQV